MATLFTEQQYEDMGYEPYIDGIYEAPAPAPVTAPPPPVASPAPAPLVYYDPLVGDVVTYSLPAPVPAPPAPAPAPEPAPAPTPVAAPAPVTAPPPPPPPPAPAPAPATTTAEQLPAPLSTSTGDYSKLAGQLKRSWESAGYSSDIVGVSLDQRADALAKQLDALGVKDLEKLGTGSTSRYIGGDSRAQAGELVNWGTYRGAPYKTYTYLSYDGKPIGYIPSSPNATTIEADPYDPSGRGILDLWDPAGTGHVKFLPTASGPGGLVGFTPQWASSSDVPAEVIAAIGIALTVSGAGAALGGALTSSLGISASAATNALIGNTIMQTVLNGGDLGAALKSSVASWAGAQVGDMVGNAAQTMFSNPEGLKLISNVANQATRATILGQDVGQAVKNTVIAGAVDFATAKIPQFSSLPSAVQSTIKQSISAAVQGQDIDAGTMLANAAKEGLVSYGLSQIPQFNDADARTQSFVSTMLRSAIDGGDLSQTAVNWAIGQANQELQKVIKAGPALDELKKAGIISEASYYSLTDEQKRLVDSFAAQSNPKDAAAKYVNQQTTTDAEIKEFYKQITGKDATDAEADLLKTFVGMDEASAKVGLDNQIRANIAADELRLTQLQSVLNNSEATDQDLINVMNEYNITPSFIEKVTSKSYNDLILNMRGVTVGEAEAFAEKANLDRPLTTDEIATMRSGSRAQAETFAQRLSDLESVTFSGDVFADQGAAELAAKQAGYNNYTYDGQTYLVNDRNIAASFDGGLLKETMRLINGALKAEGLTWEQASPEKLQQLVKSAHALYGNDVGALKGASIQDFINGNTGTFDDIKTAYNNSLQGDGFRVEVRGVGYTSDTPDAQIRALPYLPPGVQLASSQEAFESNGATPIILSNGSVAWVKSKELPSQFDAVDSNVEILSPESASSAAPLQYLDYTSKLDPTKSVVSTSVINGAKAVVDAINKYGGSNAGVLTDFASVVAQGGGELVKLASDLAWASGMVSRDNVVSRTADWLSKYGASIQSATTKQQEDNIVNAVNSATGVVNKSLAFFKAAKDNPLGALTMVGKEAVQEVPMLVASGGVGRIVSGIAGKTIGFWAATGTDSVLNAGESFSANFGETYDNIKKAGGSDEYAKSQAYKSGAQAAIIGFGSNLIADSALVKAFMGEATKITAGTFAKQAGKQYVTEWGEEFLQNASSQYNSFGKVDWDQAQTAGAIGGAIGMGVASGILAPSAVNYQLQVALDTFGRPVTLQQVLDGSVQVQPGSFNAAAPIFSINGVGVSLDNATKVVDATLEQPNFNLDTYATNLKALADQGITSANLSDVSLAVTLAPNANAATEAVKGLGLNDEQALSAVNAAFNDQVTTQQEVRDAFAKKGVPVPQDLSSFVGLKDQTTLTQAVDSYVASLPATGGTTGAQANASTGTTATTATTTTEVNPRQAQSQEILKMALGLIPKDMAYDLNGDGKITSADALSYLRGTDPVAAPAPAPAAAPVAAPVAAPAPAPAAAPVAAPVAAPAPSAADLERELLATAPVAAPPPAPTPAPPPPGTNTGATTVVDSVTNTSTNESLVASLETRLNESIANAVASGIAGDAALDLAIQKVASDLGTTKEALLGQLGKTETQLRTDFATQLGAVTTEIGNVEIRLTDAIADAKAQGLQGDAALQAAIDSVAADLGTSKDTLLSQIGKTETQLRTDFATELGDVKTELGNVESRLSAAIEAAKASGVSGDAALQQAIDSVAADLGTSREDLLIQIGKTEETLRTDFSEQLGAVTEELSNVESRLSTAIEAAKASGLAGDAALQSAIDTVASDLGTTKDALLDQIGKTETQLRTDFSTELGDVKTRLEDAEARLVEEIAAVKEAGLTGNEALSMAIDLVAADLGATKDELLTQLGKTEEALRTDFASELETVSTELVNVETRLKDAIAAAEASGMSRDEAIAASIDKVAADLGTTKEDLLSSIGKTEEALRSEFQTGLSDAESRLTTAIESAIASGLKGDEALQSAINQVSSDLGTTKDDLLTQIGKTETQLRTDFSTQLGEVVTEIGNVETRLQDAIADAEARGLTRSEAIQSALDTVAADLGTTRADLLTQLGTTESTLRSEIEASKTALGEQITTGLEGLSTELKEAENRINERAAEYESQGLSRDQALSKAITEVATQLGTTASNLQSQINQAQTSLTENIAGVKTDLQKQIDEAATLLGKPAQTVTQADLDYINSVIKGEVTTAPDMTYDVNRDGKIDQADFDYLQRISTGGGEPPEFPEGTRWAPTGLFGEISGLRTDITTQLQQQELKRQQDAAKAKAAEEAAKRRQTGLEMLKTPTGIPGKQEALPQVSPLQTSGASKFISPLAGFLAAVETGNYLQPKPQQPTMTPQPQPAQADRYSYGKEQSIDSLLDPYGEQSQQQQSPFGFKAGGLAMGGGTRYGRFAGGGLNVVHHSGKARVDFRKGDAVTGPGDGQSDDIPAMLADGEFVFPADVVAALGNGSTKAGSDKLYDMMHSIRAHARSSGPKDLPPPAKSPLEYLKGAKQKSARR